MRVSAFLSILSLSDVLCAPAFCLVLSMLPIDFNLNLGLIKEIVCVLRGGNLVEISRQSDAELSASISLDKIKKEHHLSLKASQGAPPPLPKKADSRISPPRRMMIDASLSLRVRLLDSTRSGNHFLLDLGTISASTPGMPSLLSARPSVGSEGLARSLHLNHIDISISGLSLAVKRDPSFRKGRARDAHSDTVFWILEKTSILVTVGLFDGIQEHSTLLKVAAETDVVVNVPKIPIRVSNGAINTVVKLVSSIIQDVSSFGAGDAAAEPEKSLRAVPAGRPASSLPSLRLRVRLERLLVTLSRTADAPALLEQLEDPIPSEAELLQLELSALSASVSLSPDSTRARVQIRGVEITHVPTMGKVLSSRPFFSSDSSKEADVDPESDVGERLDARRASQNDFLRASISLRPSADVIVGASLSTVGIFASAAPIKDLVGLLGSFDFSPLSSGDFKPAGKPSAKSQNPAPSSPLSCSVNISQISICLQREKLGAVVTAAFIDGVSAQIHQQGPSLEVRASLSAIRIDDLRESAKHRRIFASITNTGRLVDVIFASPAPSDAFIPLTPLNSIASVEVPYHQLLRGRLESFRVLVVRDYIDAVLEVVQEIGAVLPKTKKDTANASTLPADLTGDVVFPDPSCSSPKLLPNRTSSHTSPVFKFEIIASHPQLVLPRNSTHMQVILLDLGDLVARNHIYLLTERSTTQNIPIKVAAEAEILATLTGANCQIMEIDNEHYSQQVIDRTFSCM